MKTTVTGRHMEITPALRAHAQERVEHLTRYSGEATDATVVLSVEKYRHQAEVSLNVNGVLIQAKEETSEMYASIDEAVAKIERQLKKYKDRQHPRRQRPAAVIGEEEPVESAPAPLERERPVLKAMTPEQAAAALNGGTSPLVVFRHAGTKETNVVYRRADGSVAWIDPAP
ncbi:MAG: ribosome hibernation-promoting factor, HPF/YfiA family [Nitrospirota bacterium]